MPITASSLDVLYEPIAEELAEARRRFDRELASQLPFVDTLCERVRRYRGKMLRPTVLLLSGKSCGRLTDEHLTLAAVVEMVHVATLVHDDVLDEADVRRRTDTINATEGNQAAVLLGDYLISHAFHLCSGLNDQHASLVVGATTNTVCEGELMQIHHRADVELSEAAYLQIIHRKTAALTGTCCRLGARYAGADTQGVEAWARFGDDLGMAFQIVDDVLDLVGTEVQMGKTLGRDLALGKATLPLIHAMSQADTAVRQELAAALRNGDPTVHQRVPALLEQAGSMDYAFGIASDYIASARNHLDTVPASPARDALAAVTDFIVSRRQ